MKLTRGLLMGSMLGMAAAMMVNNQNRGSNSSYSSDMSSSNNNHSRNQSSSQNINSLNNYDNPDTNGSDLIITDIIR